MLYVVVHGVIFLSIAEQHIEVMQIRTAAIIFLGFRLILVPPVK